MGNNVILCGSTKNRPTRAFIFKLTAENLALRIFKPKDGKGKCFRLKPNEITKYGPFNEEAQGPIPPIFNRTDFPRLDKAHMLAPEDPKGKGPLSSALSLARSPTLICVGVSSSKADREPTGREQVLRFEADREIGR